MKPWEHPVPPVLYKYLPPERLHALADCRVRFSQRTVFEDDHELEPDFAIFGTESEIWRYAISIGFQLSRNGLPAGVIVQALASNPEAQKSAIQNLRQNTPVVDELGSLCLTDAPDSERMWMEYAKNSTGFVLAFDTNHRGFSTLLKGQGHVGKMSYSDEPFGSALGTILGDEGAGVLFRKRTKYSFEREWRIIRMLKRLERLPGGLFLSEFDPGSVAQVIIRPQCTVNLELQQLVTTDARYKHLEIKSNPSPPVNCEACLN
jgi:hypothetical protein